MTTERDTIKCEAVFNDDHTHRFWWRRQWSKDKPMATVITMNPSLSDNIITDTTTTLVVNNIARLGEFGGVIIVNLYSLLTSKLDFRWNADEELISPENDTYIKKAADESDVVILAWGKAAANNQRIAERVERVLSILETHKSKLWTITDGEREMTHPLFPAVRSGWNLKSFIYKQPADETSADDK